MIVEVGRYRLAYQPNAVVVTPLSKRCRVRHPIVVTRNGDQADKLPRYVQDAIWRRWRYIGYIYLLHFDRPYKHARHYLGYTRDIPLRELRHRAGNGANLLRVCQENDINWKLVRVWVGDRYEERRFKKGSSTRFCPICSKKPFPGYGTEIKRMI